MNNVDKKLQRNKYNCKQNEACNVTAAKPWSDFATGDEPLKMQLITLLLFFVITLNQIQLWFQNRCNRYFQGYITRKVIFHCIYSSRNWSLSYQSKVFRFTSDCRTNVLIAYGRHWVRRIHETISIKNACQDWTIC